MTFSKTTQYAVISVLFFVTSIGVAVFTYYFVSQEGLKLAKQMEVVGKNQLMQERYNNLLVILEASKDEHEQLNSRLLTEGKTINFLTEIETLARDMGLRFSTDSLEVEALPNPQFEAIDLRLRADGDKKTLLEFLTILETLPYFSRIKELSFNTSSGGGELWSASITLMVAMQAYDK